LGRATLVDGSGGGLDVEKASDCRFPAEPQSLFAQWDEFRQWVRTGDLIFAVPELIARL
jgi:hypothetical protein